MFKWGDSIYTKEEKKSSVGKVFLWELRKKASQVLIFLGTEGTPEISLLGMPVSRCNRSLIKLEWS